MKVRAVRKHIELPVVTGAPASPSSYEVALGQEYTVFTVDCYCDSREMEGSTLYGIKDEYGRLMLYPAALFEITDARASKYWLAGYSEGSFYLRHQEFVDNVYHLR